MPIERLQRPERLKRASDHSRCPFSRQDLGLLQYILYGSSILHRWPTTNSPPEEGFRLLDELFGSDDPSAPPTRGCRKYVLEYQNGEPVFRFAKKKTETVLPRSELDVFFDDLMTELFGPDPDGDEIVPQKLAKLFPVTQIVKHVTRLPILKTMQPARANRFDRSGEPPISSPITHLPELRTRRQASFITFKASWDVMIRTTRRARHGR
jgi:hypothetical protein